MELRFNAPAGTLLITDDETVPESSYRISCPHGGLRGTVAAERVRLCDLADAVAQKASLCACRSFNAQMNPRVLDVLRRDVLSLPEPTAPRREHYDGVVQAIEVAKWIPKITDTDLLKECERRKLISGDFAVVDPVRASDDAVRAEIQRRWPESEAAKAWMELSAERDEWKRKAVRAELDLRMVRLELVSHQKALKEVHDAIEPHAPKDEVVTVGPWLRARLAEGAAARKTIGEIIALERRHGMPEGVDALSWLAESLQFAQKDREKYSIGPVVVDVSKIDVSKLKLDSVEVGGITLVAPRAASNCNVCGAPPGFKCTKECDDDAVLNHEVKPHPLARPCFDHDECRGSLFCRREPKRRACKGCGSVAGATKWWISRGGHCPSCCPSCARVGSTLNHARHNPATEPFVDSVGQTHYQPPLSDRRETGPGIATMRSNRLRPVQVIDEATLAELLCDDEDDA